MYAARLFLTFLVPLALLSGVALGQDAPPATADEPTPADCSPEAIAKRFAHYRPAIEKELGAAFEKPVRYRLAEADEIRDVIAAESAAFRSEIEGGPRGEELAAVCRKDAAAIAAMLIAKIDLESGDILLHHEALGRMAAVAPELAGMTTQAFLDVILIHEAVHAHQHRTWDMRKFIGRPRTLEALSARTAVIEGHAQYIAHRVAKRAGLEKAFDLLVRANSEVPSSVTEPGQRLVLEVLVKVVGFAYVQGEEWYAAVVEAVGPAEAEKKAFTAPPTRMREISRPAEYLHPPAEKGLDLKGIADNVVALLESEKTFVQLIPMAEPAVRGALAIAGPKEVEKGLAEFRASFLVHAALKDAEQGTFRAVALIEHETIAAAEAFLALERLAAEARDEQFRKPGGLVKLESSVYEETGMEGVPGYYTAKRVSSPQLPKPIIGKTIVFRRGAVVVEVVVTNLPDTREQVTELAKKVLALIPE